MLYITVKEAAAKWDVTARCVQNYCISGKIPGAKSIGKQWLIPIDADKPIDKRTKNKIIINDRYHFPLFTSTPLFNNSNELNEDENILKKAQIYYLEGNFIQAISISRELLLNDIPTYLKVGAYFTIGFSLLLLGIHSEYKITLKELKKIMERVTIHQEDYRLLYNALEYHTTWNHKLIDDIDPNKISFEASVYYKYVLFVSLCLSGKIKKNHSSIINMFISECSFLQYNQITPALSAYYNLLGTINIPNYSLETKKYYLEKGIKIAVDNHWLTGLTKYYMLDIELFEETLGKIDNKYLNIVKEKQTKNITNWKIIHLLETGMNKEIGLNNNQTELLFLISYELTNEEISKIKNISLDTVNEEINNICNILKINSMDNLVEYTKNFFNSLV